MLRTPTWTSLTCQLGLVPKTKFGDFLKVNLTKEWNNREANPTQITNIENLMQGENKTQINDTVKQITAET